MSVLVNVILAVQILAALGMIGLILVQHGKGADMGAAFGSGSSGSLFGASGSARRDCSEFRETVFMRRIIPRPCPALL